jgi:hypothetical protein
VATTLNNLGLICDSLGKHEEAEEHYKRAIAIYDNCPKPDLASLAACLENLAHCYVKQDKQEEAEPIGHRLLELQVQRFGLVHGEVSLVLRNLARIYHRQSKFEEAMQVRHGRSCPENTTSHGCVPVVQMYECAIKVREKLGATNSPTFVKVLANLSDVYDALNMQDKATVARQRIRSIIDAADWPSEEKQSLLGAIFPKDAAEVSDSVRKSLHGGMRVFSKQQLIVCPQNTPQVPAAGASFTLRTASIKATNQRSKEMQASDAQPDEATTQAEGSVGKTLLARGASFLFRRKKNRESLSPPENPDAAAAEPDATTVASQQGRARSGSWWSRRRISKDAEDESAVGGAFQFDDAKANNRSKTAGAAAAARPASATRKPMKAEHGVVAAADSNSAPSGAGAQDAADSAPQVRKRSDSWLARMKQRLSSGSSAAPAASPATVSSKDQPAGAADDGGGERKRSNSWLSRRKKNISEAATAASPEHANSSSAQTSTAGAASPSSSSTSSWRQRLSWKSRAKTPSYDEQVNEKTRAVAAPPTPMAISGGLQGGDASPAAKATTEATI